MSRSNSSGALGDFGLLALPILACVLLGLIYDLSTRQQPPDAAGPAEALPADPNTLSHADIGLGDYTGPFALLDCAAGGVTIQPWGDHLDPDAPESEVQAALRHAAGTGFIALAVRPDAWSYIDHFRFIVSAFVRERAASEPVGFSCFPLLSGEVPPSPSKTGA